MHWKSPIIISSDFVYEDLAILKSENQKCESIGQSLATNWVHQRMKCGPKD